jgi:hypothetical protein
MPERSRIVNIAAKLFDNVAGDPYNPSMATKKPFEINLADLEEIRSKIREVEAIVEEERERVSEAQRQFAYWQSILDRLRLVSGQKPTHKATTRGTSPTTAEGESAIDRIVRTLHESAIPLRANGVAGRLTEPMTEKTVRWALWKAGKEGRIQKLEPGLYASLDYTPSQNGSQARLDEE